LNSQRSDSNQNCLKTPKNAGFETRRFSQCSPHHLRKSGDESIYKELGGAKKEKTSQLIREYLEDYDYNQQGIMKYDKISDVLKCMNKKDPELRNVDNR